MQDQILARIIKIDNESGLIGQDSVKNPFPPIKAYNYKGMYDFCQIVSCHTTRLYASLGFSNSQKGYSRRVNGIDYGDGDKHSGPKVC